MIDDLVGFEREQAPVRCGGRTHEEQLVAGVARGDQVLAAVLDPLHGTPEPPREPGDDELLGVDVRLLAKAATDAGTHDAHVLLLETERRRQRDPKLVRPLGGRPDDDAVAVWLRDDAARLERQRRRAPVAQLGLDHDGRGRECSVDVTALDAALDVDVRPPLVQERRVACKRVQRIDERHEGVEVELDRVDAVLRCVARFGDDDHDRLADEAHDALGEQRARRGIGGRRLARRDERRQADVGSSERSRDAARRQGARKVDVQKAAVREWAADERRVEQLGTVDVVDELRHAPQEGLVLEAQQRATERGTPFGRDGGQTRPRARSMP